MRKLEVEENPYIKAYSYHSYPLSILGSGRFCGEKKAEIMIKESKKYQWNYYTNEVSIDNLEDMYTIHGNDYADNIEGHIFREADIEDEITVRIDYIQYTQPYGYICLFFGNEELIISETENKEDIYQIGVYNKGVIFSGSNGNMVLHESILCKDYGYYLKLERKNDQIFYWFSDNEENWILVSKLQIQNDNRMHNLHIGINLFLGENQFYNWLFTNYIQLYGRNVFASEYFVDYFVTPEKDGNFYTVHSLLDFCNMDKSVLFESGIDLIEFIKTNIDKGNYIEFKLNEYYIKDTHSYQKESFDHQTLVYGYDEIGVYIVGYVEYGKIKARRVDYDSFQKALDNHINLMIIISFTPLDNYFKLNIETMKRSLYEYWKGIDTNQEFDFILPKRMVDTNSMFKTVNRTSSDNLPEFLNRYGIKIYDLFLENEIMFDYLLKDARIPYVIYEHKKIMKDRVLFLQQKHHIKDEYINAVIEDTDRLLNQATDLLSICLKSAIKSGYKNTVRESLQELKKFEENYYARLLDSLY